MKIIRQLYLKLQETGRGLWIVILLLALCWSFCFQYSSVYTSANVSSEKRELPIYSVETEEKVVSITFDSAWNIDDLDEILDILKRNEVKTTFFMTGDWIERYPEAVKKIYEDGHDLANHGENHKNMSTLSRSECIEEIQKVHNRIYELLGIEMNLFRPPSGDYNNTVIEAARELDYEPIQWDIDSLDWKNYGVEDMVERVLNSSKLRNGSIILLHNGTKYTKDALQQIIDGLKNKGYALIPVSELIYRENYTIDYEGRQHKQ